MLPLPSSAGIARPDGTTNAVGNAHALVEAFQHVLDVVDDRNHEAPTEVVAEFAFGQVDRAGNSLDHRIGHVCEQLPLPIALGAGVEDERLLDLRGIQSVLGLQLEPEAAPHEHALAAVLVDRDDDVVVEDLVRDDVILARAVAPFG
ncbi:hypothetical protein GCM10009862_30510 [Microbacterium binotii]|uniref:Uncharacterized protein n=1 Tax=Microbacterium binotii TaxID=462710 RepID=A0ABN3PLV6_9MICO